MDQVRRRERIKRRLAEVRQREIMLRFQPPPRAMLSASLPPKPALDPLAHGPVDPGEWLLLSVMDSLQERLSGGLEVSWGLTC